MELGVVFCHGFHFFVLHFWGETGGAEIETCRAGESACENAGDPVRMCVMEKVIADGEVEPTLKEFLNGLFPKVGSKILISMSVKSTPWRQKVSCLQQSMIPTGNQSTIVETLQKEKLRHLLDQTCFSKYDL